MSTPLPTLPRLLYTVPEVAEMCGFSPSHVYELVASGTLPSLRSGRAVRVPSDRLTQWIDEHLEG
ncbi:MAG: helix-turn-helix domain-containing protein [Actinobacteria bacterium]|nr:helix-turn-helix domain-containing protein [Actinomycetota bacterium]